MTISQNYSMVPVGTVRQNFSGGVDGQVSYPVPQMAYIPDDFNGKVLGKSEQSGGLLSKLFKAGLTAAAAVGLYKLGKANQKALAGLAEGAEKPGFLKTSYNTIKDVVSKLIHGEGAEKAVAEATKGAEGAAAKAEKAVVEGAENVANTQGIDELWEKALNGSDVY
ncbi:hypothetical protein IJG72_03445 [bacterium]|nr:hypothetical protein [bacterium]